MPMPIIATPHKTRKQSKSNISFKFQFLSNKILNLKPKYKIWQTFSITAQVAEKLQRREFTFAPEAAHLSSIGEILKSIFQMKHCE